MAALNHPHICTLHDVGSDYLVMEYLVGSDLGKLIGTSGADVLIGGAGADRLTGGAGDDIFRYLAFNESTSAARDGCTSGTAASRMARSGAFRPSRLRRTKQYPASFHAPQQHY